MKAENCGEHRDKAELWCLNCDRAICDRCTYYKINLRPWCHTCAKGQTGTSSEGALKLLAFLVVGAGVVFAAGEVMEASGTLYYGAALTIILFVGKTLFMSGDGGGHSVQAEEVSPRRTM